MVEQAFFQAELANLSGCFPGNKFQGSQQAVKAYWHTLRTLSDPAFARACAEAKERQFFPTAGLLLQLGHKHEERLEDERRETGWKGHTLRESRAALVKERAAMSESDRAASKAYALSEARGRLCGECMVPQLESDRYWIGGQRCEAIPGCSGCGGSGWATSANAARPIPGASKIGRIG